MGKIDQTHMWQVGPSHFFCGATCRVVGAWQHLQQQQHKHLQAGWRQLQRETASGAMATSAGLTVQAAPTARPGVAPLATWTPPLRADRSNPLPHAHALPMPPLTHPSTRLAVPRLQVGQKVRAERKEDEIPLNPFTAGGCRAQ